MKLYYVGNIRIPTEKAHGYQIMKTCEALKNATTDVSLIVADRRNPLASIDPFERYGVTSRFPIVKLAVIDLLPWAPSWLQMPAFVFEQWTFLRSLKRWMTTQSSGVWYTRSATIAQTILRTTSDPVYVELHAMPSAREFRGLERVRGFVCLTSWLAEQMRIRFPQIPCIVIPDAVDLETFQLSMSREMARAELGLETDATWVMYGGRFSTLDQGKGLGWLDRAVANLSQSFPSVRLALVGGTDTEFHRIEGHPPAPTTRCIDLQPRSELAKYYRAADVLAMPFPFTPHYAYEMSPLKMFEYMASGTMMLTTDLPSVRDVLNESTALFTAPDADGVQRGLQQALEMTSNDRDAIGKQAQQQVKTFTWSSRAKRIQQFILDPSVSTTPDPEATP